MKQKLILGAALAFAALLPALARSQEGQGPPPVPEMSGPGEDELTRQMKELFRTVERNLKQIDVLLNDASAGEGALGELEDSGLDDLLKSTQASSKTVVNDIDRILELARQRGKQQSSSQGGGQGQEPKPSPGTSPLDEARDRGPKPGESTPEKPEEGGKEPHGEKPKQPDSPAGSDDPGATKPGDPFHPERGPAVPPGQDADEWGMLPAKVQEIFRNEGASDLPVQYRDWIDSYYRRLNRASR
jgi:hypothetical protein